MKKTTNWPPIKPGTKVTTTKVNPKINNWSEEAKQSRQWGIQGTVIKHYGGHGLCYEVEHKDGTIGYYDPSEFQED